jgi:hypothetical protein
MRRGTARSLQVRGWSRHGMLCTTKRGAATGRTALLLLPRRAAGMRCGQFAECTATFCALTTGDECAEKRDLESVERLAGSLTCHQLARPLHATLVTSGPV